MSFFHLQEIDHHHLPQIRTNEHTHMDSGGSTVIRSYDCVFCQRGFTTAQALGGHMNIHRKDRATPTTPTNKRSTSPTKEPTNTILSNKEILLLEEGDQVDIANTRLFYSSNSYVTSQDHLHSGGSSSFDGRLHRFLGSEKFEDHHNLSSPNMVGKRIHDHGHSMEGEELDLELRLGHYSW